MLHIASPQHRSMLTWISFENHLQSNRERVWRKKMGNLGGQVRSPALTISVKMYHISYGIPSDVLPLFFSSLHDYCR